MNAFGRNREQSSTGAIFNTRENSRPAGRYNLVVLCQERERLIGDFRAAVRKYAHVSHSTMRPVVAKTRIEEARAACLTTLNALEIHEQEHCCVAVPAAAK